MKIIESNDSSMNSKKLGDIIRENKKSKLLVSEASNTGEYPFYNSSQKLTMSHNDFLLDGVKIVLSTGGDYSSLHLTDGKFAHSSDTYVVESNDDEILTEYIYYFLVINKNMLDRCFEGTKLKHLNKKMLKKEYVPYPDIETQKKIITLLNSHKSYLQSIQTLISKMEQRNQYYFDKIFFGEIRFNKNGEVYDNSDWKSVTMNGYNKDIPKEWSISSLEDVVCLEKGVNIPVSELNYDGGIQYLRSGDIWEKASSSKDNLYYSGDDSKKITYKSKEEWIICFDGYNTNPFNGTIGLVTNYGEGTLSGRLYKIKGIDKKSLEFVNVALLQSLYMKNIFFRFSEGSMSKSVTKHAKKFDFPVIPMEEQVHINNFSKKLLDEVDLLKRLYLKEKQVFQWLCEKLVSGEYKIEE